MECVQIEPETPSEQERILGDDGNILSQLVKSNLENVNSVQANGAFRLR